MVCSTSSGEEDVGVLVSLFLLPVMVGKMSESSEDSSFYQWLSRCRSFGKFFPSRKFVPSRNGGKEAVGVLESCSLLPVLVEKMS